MSNNERKFAAVDFDGTVVKHEYPGIGETVPGAIKGLKKLINAGFEIILYTMRSGQYLQEAIDWYVKNEIPLSGINTNPLQKNWTDSPKAYAKIYIDDAAVGCPLIINPKSDKPTARPYVNWEIVIEILGI